MQANKLKTILAIETSCDETAAAILHGVPKAKIRSHDPPNWFFSARLQPWHG
jgi:hypothetical protein